MKTQNGYNIANGGEGGANNFAGKTSKEMDDIKKRNSESQKRVWENKTQEELRLGRNEIYALRRRMERIFKETGRSRF